MADYTKVQTTDGLGNEGTLDEKLRAVFQDDQDEFHREIRIEALRAASAVVAAEVGAGLAEHDSFNRPDERAMFYAEIIAHWIETGKR